MQLIRDEVPMQPAGIAGGGGAGRSRSTGGVDHGLFHRDRPCGGRRARRGGVPRRGHRP